VGTQQQWSIIHDNNGQHLLMAFLESKVGDETIQLLRDTPRRNQNYQTYEDLFHNPLGSLKLLAIPVPKQSSPESKRFRGNIYLPIRVFKEINEYLDLPSSNSLRCASRSLKSAIDIAKTYDPSRDKPLFRIETTNFMNRLRGMVSNSSLTQYAPVTSEDFENERNNELVHSDPHLCLWWLAFAILVFVFIVFLYIFVKMGF
jgi:hypothetical protein